MSGNTKIKRSIRYYVIVFSEMEIKLYEGYKDFLIEIHEEGFPIMIKPKKSKHPEPIDHEIKTALADADKRFGFFYRRDPLPLVLLGNQMYRSIFRSLSKHPDAIMAGIEKWSGDMSPEYLGKTTWQAVKEILTGAREKALEELESAKKDRRLVTGVDAVWQKARQGLGDKLLVEENYRITGRMLQADEFVNLCKEIDTVEIMDDAVDVIIEKVLKTGGNVVFMKSGSLKEYEKIALLLRDSQT